jgi:glycosyltransferase involved in cell wall biosynthesis
LGKKIFFPLNAIEENRISSEKYFNFLSNASNIEFQSQRFSVNKFVDFFSFLSFDAKVKLTKYFLSNFIYSEFDADSVHILEQSNLYLVNRFSNKRIIVTIHDIIPILAYSGNIKGYSYPHNPLFFKRNLIKINSVDKIVVVSSKTQFDLCNYFQKDFSNISVIHNPINPQIKKYNSGLLDDFFNSNCINPYTKKILIVGLSEIKNIEFSVSVFLKLLISEPTLELHMVGSSKSLSTPVRGLILNYSNNIFIHENIDDPTLGFFYSMSKILLFPSFYEGFGLPLIEAMQCGAVVVASDRGAIPEVVSDAGFTLSLDDESLFVDIIHKLLTDNLFHSSYVEKGLLRAKEFSIDLFLKRYLSLYNE